MFTEGVANDDYGGGHFDAYAQTHRTDALLRRTQDLQTPATISLTTEEAQALTQAGYTLPSVGVPTTAYHAETVHFTAQHFIRGNVSHAPPTHAFQLDDIVYDRRNATAPAEPAELTVTGILHGMAGAYCYQLNGGTHGVSEQYLTRTRPTHPQDGAAAAAAAAEVFLLAPNCSAESSEAFQALMTMDYGNIGE
jgi:hypothetical protein